MFEDFAEQVFCPIPRKCEENNQVFSISSHLRQQVSGGEFPASKREGYSTLPSAKTIAKTIAGKYITVTEFVNRSINHHGQVEVAFCNWLLDWANKQGFARTQPTCQYFDSFQNWAQT